MNDDDERMRNFLMFKIWATDDEIGRMPWGIILGITIVILLGIVLGVYFCSGG